MSAPQIIQGLPANVATLNYFKPSKRCPQAIGDSQVGPLLALPMGR
jgi:hypothetical protein